MAEATSSYFNYRDLIVWQKAMDLVTAVYAVTEQFPQEELFGLTMVLRRSAVAIASQIAEGKRRGSKAELISFLKAACGSGAELETQIELAKRLPQTKDCTYTEIDELLTGVMRMLPAMIKTLSTPRAKSEKQTKETKNVTVAEPVTA
ncbi:MAG: hypothetical protein RIQ56_347 [Candidatus Parcubacteria bacterium]